jgi:lysophospholipid acyltransferase (LPLAT)-like uncharacterized protein
MWEKLKAFFIVELAAFAHWIVRSTWRLKRGPLPPEIAKRISENLPVVFGHLHQDDLSLIAFFKDHKVGVLVSQSKDGTLLAKYFTKIGWRVARGSSSKGAASGFLELLRMCKAENLKWITFAVDGPRGPVGKTKSGIFKLAEILNAPVVPVVTLAPRRWTLNRAWSKTFIPKPFSKIEVKFLEPISASDVERYSKQKQYSKLAELFDNQIAHQKVPSYF